VEVVEEHGTLKRELLGQLGEPLVDLAVKRAAPQFALQCCKTRVDDRGLT
jgi:hypothetical protein